MFRFLLGTLAAAPFLAVLSQSTIAHAQIFYPAPTVVYRPAVPTCCEPTTVYYGGPVIAPAPVVVAPTYAPVPITTTRYRPILGGTVTRTRYYYAPTTVVAPVW